MKVVCVSNHWVDDVLGIKQILTSLDIEIEMFYTESYYDTLSRIQKKFYKLGLYDKKEEYLKRKQREFAELMNGVKPDILLCINSPNDLITPAHIKEHLQKTKLYMWFVDGIRHMEYAFSYLPICNKIYVFEPNDVKYIKDTFNITHAFYCPVGYGQDYEVCNSANTEKKYDICFVGTPTKHRLILLEKVAKHAMRCGYKMWASGKFYDARHFWKKYIFRFKYPALYQYIYNGDILPKHVAQIYCQSKVCLNIHNVNHSGLNPRNFDIMATGSFLLVDKREDYGDLIHPGEDCEMYFDENMLLDKLDYYLQHEDERNTIAQNGLNNVINKLGIKHLLNNILNGRDDANG